MTWVKVVDCAGDTHYLRDIHHVSVRTRCPRSFESEVHHVIVVADGDDYERIVVLPSETRTKAEVLAAQICRDASPWRFGHDTGGNMKATDGSETKIARSTFAAYDGQVLWALHEYAEEYSRVMVVGSNTAATIIERVFEGGAKYNNERTNGWRSKNLDDALAFVRQFVPEFPDFPAPAKP